MMATADFRTKCSEHVQGKYDQKANMCHSVAKVSTVLPAKLC